MTFLVVGFLFFLSGASGLILEVIWTRKIALLFGSTVYSASLTIGIYLLGLGLGAYAIGRWAEKIKKPVFTYSCLQLMVGISGFIVTVLLNGFPDFLVFIMDTFPAASGFIHTVLPYFKVVVITFLLLVPCITMGATLPVLTQRFTTAGREFGKALGTLYAVNTIGAAAGAFAADFFLVERIGVAQTAYLACFINVFVGLVALLIGKEDVAEAKACSSPPSQGEPTPRALIYLVFLTSGFVGIALEILWTRMLVFFSGSDVTALSSMLVTFLIGIFIGSLIAARVSARIKNIRLVVALLMLMLALVSYLSIWESSFISPLRAVIMSQPGFSYRVFCFLMNFLLMLPSTIILGVLFPLNSLALSGERETPAETTGKAYLANTLGSISGSLLTGFILIPQLGIQSTLSLVTIILLLVGGILAFSPLRESRGWGWRVAVIVCTILPLAVMAATPTDLLRRIVYQGRYGGILHSAEDVYGAVALVREWDDHQCEFVDNLITDGYNMAGNNLQGKRYTYCLGALPILLCDKPDDVLVIAVGVANTIHACTSLNVTKRVDGVDLSEKIVETVKMLPEVKETLEDEKVKIHIDDGRNFLLLTDRKYDVITAEPPPPTNAGIVNLYSREYYQLVKRCLKEKGVTSQWLPCTQLSEFEAKTIIRAFQEVFPWTYAWSDGTGYVCLIGSLVELEFDYSRISQIVGDNRGLFQRIGLENPELILAGFAKGPDSLRDYTKSTPPLTDDHPYIQYSKRDWGFDWRYFCAPTDESPINITNMDSAQKERIEEEINRGKVTLRKSFLYLYGQERDAFLNDLVKTVVAKQVLNEYPENAFFRNMMQCSDAQKAFFLSQAVAGKDPARNWYRAALSCFYRGKNTEALDLVGKTISQVEKDLAITPGEKDRTMMLTPRLLQGLIYESSANPGEALETYDSIMNDQSHSPVNEAVARYIESRIRILRIP